MAFEPFEPRMVGQVLPVPPSIGASPPWTQLSGHRIIAVVAKRPVEFDEWAYYMHGIWNYQRDPKGIYHHIPRQSKYPYQIVCLLHNLCTFTHFLVYLESLGIFYQRHYILKLAKGPWPLPWHLWPCRELTEPSGISMPWLSWWQCLMVIHGY